MDKSMQLDNVGDGELKLPVCDLKHRVKISAADSNGLYKYKCCDARDCYWKKQSGNDSYCRFDSDH